MTVPPFHWWRTVFWLIPAITVYTIILGTLSIGSSLLSSRGYFAHACARMWSRLILATTGVRVQIRGLEQLQRGKTYVFVANHQSIYDIPVVFASLPYQLRIIAKDSLGSFPFLGWHLSRTGHLLVDRRKADPRAVFNWANSLTGRGLSLIVFPEGTRSATGHLGPFKGGSLYPAVQAGLPIVPISIAGSRHVMRKGRLMTCPGEVELVVHEPIETVAAAEPNIREVRALAQRVRAIIAPPVEAEASGLGAPGLDKFDHQRN
ncbi:MAG TPA: lysophospholipid acyltransferase family protein [Vicinamibacterales bacterium]|nr:lysophospholipid acyltransferase family protein [Vicinamibacterales bacterium]